MKCPLTLKANFYVQSGLEVVGMDCLKNECAWWDFERGCCCHKSIYLELDRLVAKKEVKP